MLTFCVEAKAKVGLYVHVEMYSTLHMQPLIGPSPLTDASVVSGKGYRWSVAVLGSRGDIWLESSVSTCRC